MSFLGENIVTFHAEASDAEEAIRISGDLLMKGGYATKEYKEAMIASYKQNGPYFVIAPGIAIPHARPEDGALASAVSFVQLATPVEFGSQPNDPVKFIFGLSAADGEEHVRTIQKIVKFLKAENNMEQLNNIQTYEELELLKEKEI